ncbi:MAG: VanZ family protein [Myxococcota bacterium]|nr:VanZ family protein [Myxococcota bacterium]
MANRGSKIQQTSRRLLVVATVLFGLALIGVVALANSGSATAGLLSIVQNIPGRDKTVHFLLMGTMALLLNLCWRAERWQMGPVPVLKGSIVVAVVVTLEEFSQLFVPLRSFSLEDLAYDYLGIFLMGQCASFYVAWTNRALARRGSDGGGGSGADPL